MAAQGVEAFTVQLDYSYDTSGFFNDPKRRACLQKAAAVFERRIQNLIPAIIPSGNNTWSLGFPNPATGEHVSLLNPTIPGNTIRIYVGARDIGGLVGYAEYGYSWNGFGSWITLFNNRDNAKQFQSVGGSIVFNDRSGWYFDDDPATLEPFDGFDFYSVAQHEIAHLLGFGTCSAFTTRTDGGNFVGANAVAFYGGPVPLGDSAHLAQGLYYRHQYSDMAPAFSGGLRTAFSELDFAVLRDLGWHIAVIPTVQLTQIALTGDRTTLRWQDGIGPFRVEATDDLDAPAWHDVTADLPNRAITIDTQTAHQFFRITDLAQ